jgi:hypothetical protein
MKKLRKLGAAVALTSLLGLSAFAGQLETPPCAPPEPGQLETPPCAAVQTTPDEFGASTQIGTQPASNAADIYSFAGLALNIWQSALPLF